MGKRRKAEEKKPEKLEGEAAVAWSNELRQGRPWEEEWAAFLAKPERQDWWVFHGQAGPLYVIPPDIVRYLARPFGKHDPILPQRDMQIETEFHELCRGFRADIVGVWDGLNIPHPLLGQRRDLSQMFRDNPERWELLGWSEEHKAALRRGEFEERSDVVRRNLVRQAGRLISSKEFLNERDDLRRIAEGLDLGLVFPLERKLTDVTNPDDGNLREQVEQFHEEKLRFLNRWALMQLTTWDLPAPQGPLEEMPLSTLVTLFGSDAVVSNVYPEYFTIPLSDQQERLGRIRFPGSKVEALGRAIEPKRPDLYESAYKMWFCELALRQRFQDVCLPRGAVTHLCAAFAEMLEIQEERVTEIRKHYRFQFP
ncbi:MAG: hypothetical protein ACYSU0_02240 [Planctomycetota bacterium]|jgi:hypothetical protein